MTLLDRLRPRPRWQHPDAAVRAEAVRQLTGQEQALLSEIARTDADPRVRRAALRKLSDPRVLAERLAGEVDLEAREEVAAALQAHAVGEDEVAAQVALDALVDPRRLVQLARSARLASIRRGALARIEDPRLLAALARAADDPALRSQALERLVDQELVVEVAAKTEHKDVAMAAVDRIHDAQALEQIAARARQKAASRRARTRLDLLRPRPEPGLPAPAQELLAPEGHSSPAPAEDAAPQIRDVAAPLAVVAEQAGPSLTIESADGSLPADEDSVPVEPPAATAPPTPAEAARPDQQQAHHGAEQARQTRERERQRAQALCERLLALCTRKDLTLRDAEAALREARALPSESMGLPGKLIHRIKDARGALFARAQELREADEWSRWGNAAVQEELCRKLEALGARDDFERIARELREADARWWQFRQAPKDQAEALRQRYETARAALKARLDAYFAHKAEEETRHLEQKQALCARVEALADSSQWLKASEEIKTLQARWKEIGPVPYRQSEAIWKRFRAACDRFFARRHENLQRRKAEWAANLVRKEQLCVRAEALAASTEWESAAAELKRLQAEWSSVGPVRRSKADAVWQRFRAASDAFCERYKSRDALALAARRAEREALCLELEALAGTQAEDGLLPKLQALQARWRRAPQLGPEEEAALERRFLEGRARVIAAHADAFRGSDLDPDVVRARKQKLLARLEALLASSTAAEALSGDELARRLKEALAGNTIGGPARAEAQRKAELEEAEAARAAWSRLPLLPDEAGNALEQRFRDACARFFSERQPPAPARPGRVSPRAKPAGTSRASRTP